MYTYTGKAFFLFFEIPTLHPSTHCLFISLFTYAQRSLKPTDFPPLHPPKPRDLSKSEKRLVQLQPLTNFTTLNPLFIYLPVYLRPAVTQTY